MEPELSLEEQFKLVPYINPKTGEEVVVGSPQYNILVNKYGEPYKIRSPISNALIGVGKGVYMNLKKEGYSDRDLILGYNNQNNQTNSNLTPLDISLMDDIITEIYNNSKLYGKLTLCKINKTLNTLCNHDRSIITYKFNIHQKITDERSGYYIYVIHNNKLYLNSHQLVNIPLSDNIIPVSVAATQKSIIILTKNGKLYGKGNNLYGELGTKMLNYDNFTEMDKPPGDILQIDCNQYQTVVLTTEGIFTYGHENRKVHKKSYVPILSKKDIYFMYPFSYNQTYWFATSEGLFYMEKKKIKNINIDGINDILFIHKSYILTTTGLYKAVPRAMGMKIKRISVENVKKIAVDYDGTLNILTNDNTLYQKSNKKIVKLPYNNVIDICIDVIIVKTSDGIKSIDLYK